MEEVKIRISVLVPVYNVEKDLPRCLDSLLGQTLRDIEVICVNDDRQRRPDDGPQDRVSERPGGISMLL